MTRPKKSRCGWLCHPPRQPRLLQTPWSSWHWRNPSVRPHRQPHPCWTRHRLRRRRMSSSTLRQHRRRCRWWLRLPCRLRRPCSPRRRSSACRRYRRCRNLRLRSLLPRHRPSPSVSWYSRRYRPFERHSCRQRPCLSPRPCLRCCCPSRCPWLRRQERSRLRLIPYPPRLLHLRRPHHRLRLLRPHRPHRRRHPLRSLPPRLSTSRRLPCRRHPHPAEPEVSLHQRHHPSLHHLPHWRSTFRCRCRHHRRRHRRHRRCRRYRLQRRFRRHHPGPRLRLHRPPSHRSTCCSDLPVRSTTRSFHCRRRHQPGRHSARRRSFAD